MGRKRKKRQPARPKAPMLAKVIFILVALSLAVPLLASFHPHFTPFYFKWLTFQVLTELIFACWVLLAVADRRFRPDWRNPIVIGLLVMVAATVLTLPFAVDPSYSFWSRPGRMTGVVNYLHYYSWLFVLLAVVKEVQPARRLLSVSCVVATGVGLFGLGVWLDKPTKTMLATMDNPSFFGAYMMMHVFVALYLLFSAKSFGARAFYVIALAVALITVPLSGSRGALLVTVLGLVLLPLGLMAISNATKRRKLIVMGSVVGLVALLIGTIAWLRLPSARSGVGQAMPTAIQRIAYKNFGNDRWQLWSYALQGGLEKPLFGWGNEQYELMFYRLYDPTGNDRLVLNERFADRAHNQYLDTFVASGLIGLLAYLFFLGTIFWAAFVTVRRADTLGDKRISVFIATAAAVHSAYSFFLFDIPSALVVVFLWFVLAAAHYRAVLGVSVSKGVGSRRLARYLALPMLGLAVAVMLACNILPARKLSQVVDAKMEVAKSRTRALELYRLAYSGYSPYLDDMRLSGFDRIQVYAENVSLVSSQMESLLRFMAGEYVAAAESRSYNVRYQLAAAAVHRMLGVYDAQALEIADGYAQRALAESPNRFGPYVEVAEIAMVRGQADEAIRNFQLAIERIPEMNRYNHSYMQFRLACAHALKCDHENSHRSFDEAAAMNHPNRKDSRLVIAIGQSCGADQNFAWAEPHVDDVLLIYPDHPEILRSAAKIYVASGSPTKAAEALKQLRKRDPQGADQLAEELGFIKDTD